MKILLICDVPNLSSSVVSELESGGYLVTVFYESVEQILDSFLAYDIILVSSNLSFCSYLDLVKKMRSVESSQSQNADVIPILILNNQDSLDERIRCSEVGSQELVEVGIPGKLLHRVDSYLRPEMLWRGMKALVVEDESISAKYIEHILKSKGLDVHVLKDGLEAFEYIKENPDIDIVLTDHMMPKLTGIEFIEKVRNELGLKELPVVFISSIQNPKEVLSFYKAGGNGYLSKPIIKEELQVKVSQFLNLRVQSKQLKDQVAQLEELNKVKNRFIAVCSHDLRAPLNLIMGLSEMMSTDESGELDSKELSKDIYSSSKDLLHMVEELLSVSEVQLRKEKIDVQKIILSSVVENCLKSMDALNQKNISFTLLDKSNSSMILGNELLLARMLTNLLTNAYKFTDKDGGVVVSLKKLEEGKIQLILKDSGVGMPDEMKEKIFESMAGIGRAGTEGEKSTGLGMSIVKDIIDKHGATIDVESKVGEGTTFILKFNTVEGR